MIIIPNKPYNTNSKAEYRVFDKLREVFVNDSKYIAFHSLNLTNHKLKRFGEADFVIVCEYGVFVFEVKGGGIFVQNGQWYTIDKNNEQFRIQNPFKQAEGALHAIRSEIENSNIISHLNLSIGYGVIFPDIEWKQESAEWDLYTICDSRKFKNFEAWLKRFFNYWSSKPQNNRCLSLYDIQALKQYLRPNFKLLESLDIKLSDRKEPHSYLDILIENKKVLCFGGAGTGKTFLALELAKRLANNEKNIVLVCESNWQKRYLEIKIQNEFVTVSSIESLKIDMKRSGINSYDILIVDEGEELSNSYTINLFDEVLDGGLANGKWYFFNDINKKEGLLKDKEIETLERYNPTKISLIKNYRNAKQTVKEVGIINSVEKLKLEIDKILKNGVLASDITILSPLPYAKSTISLLPQKMKKSIVQLDDYSIRYFPIDKISFAEIRNFKGFENEVIIVIDLVKSDNIEYYVAMNRAKSLLRVIWKEDII